MTEKFHGTKYARYTIDKEQCPYEVHNFYYHVYGYFTIDGLEREQLTNYAYLYEAVVGYPSAIVSRHTKLHYSLTGD